MDLKRVLLLTLVLLLAGAGFAAAQDSGRIEGRVTRPDGTGLGGVSVRIDSLDQVTLTDADGNFVFAGLPAGTYDLTFELLDRGDSETGVAVTAGATTTVEKSVDWDVSFAETITVTSASRRAERITEAPAAVTVVTEQEIEREAAHGQLPKLLEFTPGAEVTQSGVYDFNFNTRGLNSSLNRRVVTLIDGRDPSVPFLGAQEWAAISFPLDDLASAELVRGPSSALYGANAYNGVLNLTTKQPRYSQGGEVRLTAGELGTTNGDIRWATALGGDFYLKLLGGYHASEDYTVSRNVAPEYAVFCTRSGQEDCLPRERIPLVIEDDDEIKFGGIRLDKYLASGSFFTLEGGKAELEGPVFQTGIGRVQLTDVDRPWARFNFTSTHWNLLGTWNRRDANDQRSLASGAPLYLDDENWGVEVQGNGEFAGGRGRVVGGLSYGEETIDSANPQGVQTLVFRPIDADMSAAYGQVDFDLTDALKLVLAGRYDESSLHDSQLSPKASLVWGLNPNHTLRFTYNEAFQVANYSEFFLQAQTTLPGTTVASLNLTPLENALRAAIPGLPPLGFGNVRVMALGNEDLEVEEIKTWEVGYSGILGRRAFLTIDYYNSKLENFITDLLPNVGTPLGRLNTNFGPYAPPAALPAPVQAAIVNALRANLPPTLFPFLSNNLDGTPIVALASYTNFGEVNTQGIDFALTHTLSTNWGLDLNYSWFDFEVERDIPGDPLQPNAPENQFKAGLSYHLDAFDAAVKMRWVDEFEWFVGPFRGTVPSYEVVDVSANYRISDNVAVGLNVANLLDDEHIEAWGGDLLERRALGHVSFTW